MNPPTKNKQPLTVQQREQLAFLIQRISENMTRKVSVGRDFNSINLDQLHRETHSSIEKFAFEKFGIKGPTLSRYGAAAEMADQLLTDLGRDIDSPENDTLRQAIRNQEKPTALLDLADYPANRRLMIFRVAVRGVGLRQALPENIMAAAASLGIKSSVKTSTKVTTKSKKMKALEDIKDSAMYLAALGREDDMEAKRNSRLLIDALRTLASADQLNRLQVLPKRSTTRETSPSRSPRDSHQASEPNRAPAAPALVPG